MAVATFGEGYHNFHHIFASDYRNGVRWYHWDPTKWAIKFFSWLGGAYSLRRTPWSQIIRAQMNMDEKRLKSRLQSAWQAQFQQQVDNLKARVELAHARFEQLREDYRRTAHRVESFKDQLRQARQEFRMALRQWREYQYFLLETVPVRN